MLKQPLTIPISETHYELVEDYLYEWTMGKELQQKMLIHKGFKFDGASVPQFAWSITGITPDGLIRVASLVHDYIYRHKGRLPQGSHMWFDGEFWDISNHRWSRKEADQVFGRLMREAGVSKIKRRMAYYAVRWFGGSSWKD